MSTRKAGLSTNPVAERAPRLPGLVQAAAGPAPSTPADTESGSNTHSSNTHGGDTTPAKATSTKLKNGKTKQSVYLLNSTIEDLKDAAEALAGAPGAPRGLSDLADAAIQYYIAHLQTKYNNSKPFPPRTGPLQRGPRIH